MRIVCLAVVACAGMFGACNLDPSAFERNVEAGVSMKDKQDNGGGDLVPPAKRASASAVPAPAADGGMPQPQIDAAEIADASPAAEMPDAGPSDSGTIAIAADGGKANPDPDDDAGALEPEPEPEPACTTHDCFCEAYCERGIALKCPEDPPLADCIALCQLPTKPGCEAQELAEMRCKAELPGDKYICDEDLLAFIVLGCQTEVVAAISCRTR
jgi:hypothetical protein